jgi:hypothetical protein
MSYFRNYSTDLIPYWLNTAPNWGPAWCSYRTLSIYRVLSTLIDFLKSCSSQNENCTLYTIYTSLKICNFYFKHLSMLWIYRNTKRNNFWLYVGLQLCVCNIMAWRSIVTESDKCHWKTILIPTDNLRKFYWRSTSKKVIIKSLWLSKYHTMKTYPVLN